MVPPTQASEHAPAVQTSPAAHSLPHLPQFFALMLVSTHRSPQRVVPPEQTKPQLFTEQTWSVGHGVSQAPQCAGSLPVFTQLSPHSVSPSPQLHLPAAQTWPGPQTLPHSPQLVLVFCRSTQPPPGLHSFHPGVQLVVVPDVIEKSPSSVWQPPTTIDETIDSRPTTSDPRRASKAAKALR